MSSPTHADALPVYEDSDGSIRVGGSRVLLELVVRAFQDEATPETIVERYSTLSLADAYAAIAYYRRHRREVDEYLARREAGAVAVQQEIERRTGDLSEIRARLRARRHA